MEGLLAEAGALRFEMDAWWSGFGNPAALRSALLAAELIVLADGESGLLTVASAGMNWVVAFTSAAEVAHFARSREANWATVTVRGQRLLKEVIPASRRELGVVVDVASGRRMLFPPEPVSAN